MRLDVTSPLSVSRFNSRCTAPEPEPVKPITSLAKNERSGWPNSSDNTRCWVVVKSASERLAWGGSFVPILGILMPDMGMSMAVANLRLRGCGLKTRYLG
jgi:hypothetical protein